MELLCLFIFFFFCTSCITAQQSYSGNSIMACNSTDEIGPSPAFLYTCNGENTSCPAFLIFKSQNPYDSVPTISRLTSTVPSELARVNKVSETASFPMGKEVIVPVNCYCQGKYYQANSSYIIPSIHDTYFTIANYTYQGLSTCDSLKAQNIYSAISLLPGFELRVPLRCACPTSNQTAEGVKYLLTYPIFWNDSVPHISNRFNASPRLTLDANKFSEHQEPIFPFTTILIPLLAEPSSSQTVVHIPPIYSPPDNSNPKRRNSIHKLIISIAVGASSAVVFCVFLIIGLLLKKKHVRKGRKIKCDLTEDLRNGIAKMDQVLRVFQFWELKAATDSFSSNARVDGAVFRGVLGGVPVAIKKMSSDVSMEVKLLKKINHFNLIRLHGLCDDNGYYYLVYEYMEKGSLHDWLQHKGCSVVQSWSQRIQIALDIAKGLHYLHNCINPAYVHKDITSSNVLLNENLRAKIANFGLARSAERREEVFSSVKVVGTRGYMAPEYLEVGLVTTKMDVYAFGVVMLELITGKDAVLTNDEGEWLLSTAIISIMEHEDMKTNLHGFIDPSLRGDHGMELAIAVAKLSVTCLTQDPIGRPSMDEVVSTLDGIQIGSLNGCSPQWRHEIELKRRVCE